MAPHKIRLANQIRGPDRRVAEPKMGYGEAPGLFGVIIKVCLYVFIRMVSYDFDGIFIGADSTVPSQPPEFTTNSGRRTSIYKFPDIQGQMGDIVRNPQSKTRSRGPPAAPGSFVRSRTVICRTDSGRTESRWAALKGR